MNIAILGAGAMGMLFAAALSTAHEVTLLDRNAQKAALLRTQGITVIEQDGTRHAAHPNVMGMGEGKAPCDLMLLFVKAMGSREALDRCKEMIGPHTLLLTLQNGGGHEELLAQYVPMARVLLGTTQHNASVREPGVVFHGGSGRTVIGCPLGASEAACRAAAAFAAAGIETQATEKIREAVWRKLMTNASLSALTGVFQMPMGFVTQSPSCWALCEVLVREACQVAAADGVQMNPEAEIAHVRAVSERGPLGITSICADLQGGRLTEVDTISGSVVRAAHRLQVSAPHHEMMVQLVHAMEERNTLK